jgi:hypothetical protein
MARERTHGQDAHRQDDYQQKVSHHKFSFEAFSKIASCRIVLLTWRRELDSLGRSPNPSFLRVQASIYLFLLFVESKLPRSTLQGTKLAKLEEMIEGPLTD